MSLASSAATRTGQRLAEGVWRVEDADGRKVVVKYQPFGWLTEGTAYDLLEVERDVLGLLRGAGCPVPAVLEIDREAHCIFLEWVGDRTLDDAIQAGDYEATQQAIAGLCKIERVLAQHEDRLAARVAPATGRDALALAWDEAGARAHAGLEQLLVRLGRPIDSEAQQQLDEMHAYLAARPPVLGSTDYNAHNAVVHAESGTVRFLEFAKIGWDWTERRLVQYTTSMGSGRSDGRMCSLLDSPVARLYAEESGRSDGARALDYHQIFFLLNGAALLCAALAGEPPGPALLKRWQRPARRLRQFADMLTQNVSADPVAVAFRACLTSNGGTL